jgi:hypothetical protein
MIKHPYVIVSILAVVAIVVALFFIPVPGYYDVAVTVKMTEVQSIVAVYYSVDSVSARTTGASSVIDINGLGIVWFTATSEISLQVCAGTHCKTVDETKLFPTVPTNLNFGATATVTLGYVPQGSYTVTATLTVNGANQGSGQTTVCAGC